MSEGQGQQPNATPTWSASKFPDIGSVNPVPFFDRPPVRREDESDERFAVRSRLYERIGHAVLLVELVDRDTSIEWGYELDLWTATERARALALEREAKPVPTAGTLEGRKELRALHKKVVARCVHGIVGKAPIIVGRVDLCMLTDKNELAAGLDAAGLLADAWTLALAGQKPTPSQLES